MDRFPDYDIDDNEPARSPRRAHDEETLEERRHWQSVDADDFWNDWNKNNPNRVYGQPNY